MGVVGSWRKKTIFRRWQPATLDCIHSSPIIPSLRKKGSVKQTIIWSSVGVLVLLLRDISGCICSMGEEWTSKPLNCSQFLGILWIPARPTRLNLAHIDSHINAHIEDLRQVPPMPLSSDLPSANTDFPCKGGMFCHLFKASALWADAFYKLICPSVCLFVCLSACLSVRVFTSWIFFADFVLQNMVETTLPDGLKTSGWRAYR